MSQYPCYYVARNAELRCYEVLRVDRVDTTTVTVVDTNILNPDKAMQSCVEWMHREHDRKQQGK